MSYPYYKATPGPFHNPVEELISPEFTEAVVEKVRLRLLQTFSAAQVSEIRMQNQTLPYRDRGMEFLAEHIAYRIEAAVYGREAWEQKVEKRTEKSTIQEKTGETDHEESIVSTPATWWDFAKLTFFLRLTHTRLFTWSDTIWHTYWPEMEDEPEALSFRQRGAFRIANRLRTWFKHRQNLINYTRIPMQRHIHHHYKVQNITNHIEVKKHWHICPHLNVKSDKEHISFLTNESEVGYGG